MLVHQNHAAGGGENGSIMVGMFLSLCLASQSLPQREAVKVCDLAFFLCIPTAYLPRDFCQSSVFVSHSLKSESAIFLSFPV